MPSLIGSADLCRCKLNQSAEDDEGVEPASMGHRAQDQAGGRCDQVGLPAVGVRGSPGGVLLGAQPAPPDEAQQENKGGFRRDAGSKHYGRLSVLLGSDPANHRRVG